jgi:hypothetical protein
VHKDGDCEVNCIGFHHGMDRDNQVIEGRHDGGRR